MVAVYYQGSDLPDLAVTWKDTNGAVIDFSTGWTFQAKVASAANAAALFTKSTGFVGAATAPNLVVAWSTSGELNSLAAGAYVLQVKATRIADSKERLMQVLIQVRASII